MSVEQESAAREIVNSGFAVRRTLGPDLFEPVYEQCPDCELQSRGDKVARQLAFPVVYRWVRLEGGFPIDIPLTDPVVIDLKTVERMPRIHFYPI